MGQKISTLSLLTSSPTMRKGFVSASRITHHSSRSDAFDEGLDGFDDIIEHRRRQAGISANEEDLAHDGVGPGQIANATEGLRPIFLELNHDRLTNEIPAEEHPVADFV